MKSFVWISSAQNRKSIVKQGDPALNSLDFFINKHPKENAKSTRNKNGERGRNKYMQINELNHLTY
jgi:hypothetical protein